MQINVSFTYGATVTAERQRTPRARGFVGTVPLMIPEATVEEAPIAFRIHDGSGAAPGELRIHDGKVYEACGRRGPADLDSLLTKAADGWREDRHQSLFRTGKGQGYGPYKEPYDVDAVTGLIEADPGVRRVLTTEFDVRAAEVREAASAYLLIGGRPHVRRPEPVYVREGKGVGIAEFGDDRHSPKRLFRADETERLAEACERKGARSPEGRALIEVVLPDAVRAPLPQLFLLAEAGELVSEIAGGSHFKEARMETLVAYARLRDAVAAGHAAVEGAGDRADMAGVVAALPDAIDRYRAELADREYLIRESIQADAEAAVDRLSAFEGREIDFEALAPR